MFSTLKKTLPFSRHLGTIAASLAFSTNLKAKQIEWNEAESFWERTSRFWQMQDQSVQIVVLGSILIGISCGLIGSYVVTRRLSLFGDTLSHAVLPGIAIGFIWSQSKDNLALLIGATVAGFLGVTCLSLLQKYTPIRQDSALGIVLSGFYAIGICLLTRIQKMEFGNQSGLDSFLFGQASALSINDIWGIGITLAGIGLFVLATHKELLISGFDPSYARSIGIHTMLLQYGLWILLAFCIITSLQIIGVILASALLIIPAATASLLVKRMNTYLFLASVLGGIAGLGGTFLSFLGQGLPTGPLIVLVSTFLFLLVLGFRPKTGIFSHWNFSRTHSMRIKAENTLKAVYHILESQNFEKTSITSQDLMQRMGLSRGDCEGDIRLLIRMNLATQRSTRDSSKLPGQSLITLTPKGWEYACKIVRNHRLWELYLTSEAEYAPDHVHEDAEKIEHVLGDQTIRQLERILSNPKKDPHGKLIPSLDDMEHGWIKNKNAPQEGFRSGNPA